MGESRSIRLRGYRRVFRFERRIFRFDRWRVPYPHGVPLRGIGYFLALEIGVVCVSRLPGFGVALGVLPPLAAYVGLPLLGAVALMQLRIDGRPPHHALASLLGYSLRPRCLSGLTPCPDVGEVVSPLDDVTVAHDAREPFVVAGRVKGPARLTFRYPSLVRVEAAPWVRGAEARRARARRYRVRRRPGAAPMARGKVVRVPRGREVVIE